MNLQQLEYIVAVDDLKSFTRAAERCNVTQATLSAMIKKLEIELDTVIFDRKSTPLVVTEIGQELLDEARKVIMHSKVFLEKARELNGEISGEIRVGIIPTLSTSFLPKMLQLLAVEFPKLSIFYVELNTNQIVQQLKSGQLDFGILATPILGEELEECLLYYEALLVYGVREEEKLFVAESDLMASNIWLLEEGHCLRNQMMQLCSLKEKTNTQKNYTFASHSMEILLHLVDEMGGLTIIPELYQGNLNEERKKRVRLFEAPIPVREISLVYHRPYAKKRMAEKLSEFISLEMKKHLMTTNYKNSDLRIVGIG